MFLHDKSAHRRTPSSLFSQPLLPDIPNMDFVPAFSQYSLVLTDSERRHDRAQTRHTPQRKTNASRKQIIHQRSIETVSSSSAESRYLFGHCLTLTLTVCVLRCVSEYHLNIFSWFSASFAFSFYFHLPHSPFCCGCKQQCRIGSSRCCIKTHRQGIKMIRRAYDQHCPENKQERTCVTLEVQ